MFSLGVVLSNTSHYGDAIKLYTFFHIRRLSVFP